MQKSKLRSELLIRRNSQTVSDKEKKDRAIFERLVNLPQFKASSEFFTYLSHGGEVSTDELIVRFFGKKKIVVPKISGDEICLYELHEATQFEKGRFGIREPKVCLPKKEIEHIDLMIIPGIAFDLSGYRIGFGGGYFDKLLAKVHCNTIGLAYEFQIIDKVPTHSYDVPVSLIVTEKRVIGPSLSEALLS